MIADTSPNASMKPDGKAGYLVHLTDQPIEPFGVRVQVHYRRFRLAGRAANG